MGKRREEGGLMRTSNELIRGRINRVNRKNKIERALKTGTNENKVK